MSVLSSRLEQCAGEHILDISHILVDDAESAKRVAKSIAENSFIDVDLSGCGITSRTLRMLSGSLRKNHQLQYLFLNNNKLDPAGIKTIIDILHENNNIESINLRGNQLFPAEGARTEVKDEEELTEIEELVETCCDLQNLKSICGCGEFNQEIVVSATESDIELYSDVLLLGIELKLGVDLTSLQYWGPVGLSEVFEGLKDNRTVLHAQFSRFQGGTVDFSLPMLTFLQNNSTVKSLQFAFDQPDPAAAAGYSKQQKQLLPGKSTLLCLLRGLENNVGVTSLQLDCWVRDTETTLAIAALLRKNTTLLHLTLFGSSLRAEDLVLVAHSLEYNHSLRVLSVNKAAYIADEAVAANKSKIKPPPGGNLLLAPEVKARFEASAKARKLPFIVRTEGEDHIFGPAYQLLVPAALQWEVGDTVQVRVDLDHIDVNVASAYRGQGAKARGRDEEEELWLDGSVWAVYEDQRYTIKLNTSGEVKFNIKASLVRAGGTFTRLTELSRTAPGTIARSASPPAVGRSRHASADDTHRADSTQLTQISAASTTPLSQSQKGESGAYPVVYIPGQAVEVRYLGDAEWLPGVVTAADAAQPSAVVTVEVALPLESVLEVLINTKQGTKSKEKDLHKLSDVPSWQSELVTVRDTVEVETCFVRPLPRGQNHQLYYGPQRDEILGVLGSKLFHDSGAYLRGDYVEVRLFISDTSAQSASGAPFEWKRGRVSLDRRNGTYDVRMEAGTDLAGIRGCHLRHHFRPRDVVDCRLPAALAAISPGDAQPVLPEMHDPADKAGVSNVFTNNTVHPLHRTSLPLHQLHQVPLPPPTTWMAALVLKQERSGMFAVSFEDTSNARNIISARLMPANRLVVRRTAQDLRVVAQSWPLVLPSVDPAGIAAAAVGTGTEEEPRVLSELSAIANTHVVVAEDSPVRQPSVGLSPVASFAGAVEALSTVEEGIEQPSVIEVASVKKEEMLKEGKRNGDEASQQANEVRGSISLAQPAPVPEVVHTVPPAEVPITSDTSTSTSSNARSISPFRAVSAPTRPLYSAFDINDRVEARRDDDSAWLAGRIEGIHPDNSVFFVRFVDGTTEPAVSLQHIRRVNATPARAGAKIVDRSTAASPVPSSPSKAANVTFGGLTESESVVSGGVAHANGVAWSTVKKVATHAPPTSNSSSVSTHQENPHEKGPQNTKAEEDALPRPVFPASPLVLTRPELLSAANTFVAPNTQSEYFLPENVPNDISDTPWVGKQLFPPYKSPEPARTLSLHVDICVGAWLNIFNATLKVFEPCEVEAVYPDDGLFDACNRRGELYRRIDARYIDPTTPLAAPVEAPSPRLVQVPSVPPSSPRSASVLPVVTYSAQKPVQSAQLLAQPHFSSSGESSVYPLFKIGARVQAEVQGAWADAIVVRRLSPEIYTVYLERLDEEATVVVARLRAPQAQAHAQMQKINFSPQPLPYLQPAEANLYDDLYHQQQHEDGSGDAIYHGSSGNSAGDFMYGEFGAEGSLDGSLDDDELVVVGTGLSQGISMGLLGSADNSIVEQEHDQGLSQRRGHREDHGHDYGHHENQGNQHRYEEVIAYGDRVFVDEARRPHTAPHPPHTSKSSAAYKTERSSSANRHDKYASSHNQPQQHHRHQKHITSDHSDRSSSPSPAPIFNVPLEDFVLDVSPHASQKPVSISAGLSTSELQQNNAHEGREDHLQLSEEVEQGEPVARQPEFGVCYRSHATEEAWAPMLAYLHQDPSLKQDECFRDGTEVTVVPYSDHAVFGDAASRTGCSFVYRRGGVTPTNMSSVLLNMQVQASAPEVCPVKISFYVNALIVAEVCIIVQSAGSARYQTSGSGIKGRSGRGLGSSTGRGPDRMRSRALEAQCVWRRVTVAPFASLGVFCCEIPQNDVVHAESVETRLNIINAEIESTKSLLPASIAVTFATSAEVLAQAADSIERLQVFVLNGSPQEQLTREKWLAVLSSNPVLNSFVKATIAAHGAGGEQEEVPRFYLDKLIISTFSSPEGVGEHRDWLFSVGLSPFNLENTAPFVDHSLSRALWSFDPHSAQQASLTLKVRLCTTQKAVCKLLAQFIAAHRHLVPLNVLLMPSALAKFGFGLEHARLGGEQVTSALQNALNALFVPEVRQHNEDSTDSEVRSALFLHVMGDTLGSGAKCSALPVSAKVTSAQAFALAPLLKAATALCIAHAVAEKVGAPSGSTPYPVHSIAAALRLEGLLALHDFYAHIEAVYIDTRFASGRPSSSAALALSPVDVPVSSEQMLESAVGHLENALLGLQQHDLAQAAAALQVLLGSGGSRDARIVRVGDVAHFIEAAEFHQSWRSIVEISHPAPAADAALERFETHRPEWSVVPADSFDEMFESRALSPYRAVGPPESPRRPNSPTRSPGAASSSLEAQFAQLITQHAGIKDPFTAQEAAGCLIAMGCSSSADFTSMGSLFGRADGRTDVEKLRMFLHEGGIPLFVAAKLAVFVANQSTH